MVLHRERDNGHLSDSGNWYNVVKLDACGRNLDHKSGMTGSRVDRGALRGAEQGVFDPREAV